MSLIVERRNKGRKYQFSNQYGRKLLLDEYGEPYFAQERDDATIPVPISLPKSLLKELDARIRTLRFEPDIKKRKEGLTRSRYIRALIEKDLELCFDVK